MRTAMRTATGTATATTADRTARSAWPPPGARYGAAPTVDDRGAADPVAGPSGRDRGGDGRAGDPLRSRVSGHVRGQPGQRARRGRGARRTFVGNRHNFPEVVASARPRGHYFREVV